VSNAIDKLLAKAPSETPESALSARSEVDKPHKKIISPISHPKEPSLEELLAKEEAKSVGPGQAIPAAVATAPTPPPVASAPAAGVPSDPVTGLPTAAIPTAAAAPQASSVRLPDPISGGDDDDAAALAKARAEKAAQDSSTPGGPPPPASGTDFDPNSVAL
jgi:hypothetical protein